MKRPACQCSETRVRDNIDTQANSVQLPAIDSTTPCVMGEMGKSNGLLCSHSSSGKVLSDQPMPCAATGSTRV